LVCVYCEAKRQQRGEIAFHSEAKRESQGTVSSAAIAIHTTSNRNAVRRSICLATAGHFPLPRRTPHVAERAKHATVARFGAQQGTTAEAVIEVKAGVGRHRFHRLVTALRTRQSAELLNWCRSALLAVPHCIRTLD
jgi:hypothetical protein